MSQKVFVLDDDEQTLEILQRILEKEGFEVKTKATSIGTTNEIRKFRPDIVILDIMIPDLSGDALVDLIYRNVRPRPKILFYSSKPADELAKIAGEREVDGYVGKGEGPKALVEKIKSLL